MATTPATTAPPESFDAALVEVSAGASVVGVPFVCVGGGEDSVMGSAPTPVELAQSVDMKRGSETNVISAHCSMDVS